MPLKIAVASFVKTPGLTPAKTRLGKQIGQQKAEDFYLKSIQATEDLFLRLNNQCPHVDFYWSVTEKNGESHKIWNNFPVVSQGEGSLGERIHTVYSTLKNKSYDAVFLYGSDSPHVSLDTFLIAFQKIETADSVLGLTEDGGYYLLGSKHQISSSDWMGVSYSTETTGEETKSLLLKKGTLFELPITFDIDFKEDLERLIESHPQFIV